MKKIPLGVTDFKELIEQDYYYIDKTMLIKEIYEPGQKVTLVTRPRRFGKTLNISMLKYFFEKTIEDNSHLFKNTAIWKDQEFVKKHQGQYPVIFLTFKDIKETNLETAYDQIIELVIKEFSRHQETLLPSLKFYELEQYNSILLRTASKATYLNSLHFLSELLYRHYKSEVIVFIDEYDTPVHAAYIHGFYENMINFLRILLPTVLKDNRYLKRGFLTGILTIAKAGVLSGLNNLTVFTITNEPLQDKFGFTDSEVMQLLNQYNLEEMKDNVIKWYNGYVFGNTTIYNPWSLLNFVYTKGQFQLYWINTADNKLIKNLIENSLTDVREDLEALLSDRLITKEIDDTIIYQGIETKSSAIWSLFLFTGYLTHKECKYVEGILNCNLTIPNKEIYKIYQKFIKEIFDKSIDINSSNALFKAIVNGDATNFQKYLQEFIITSLSYHDISSKEPEQSYHIFILGLVAYMSDDYEIRSNRESGSGRYDIMLIPKDIQKAGIIIEFKKAKKIEDLEKTAQSALNQIKTKNYDTEIKSRGIKNSIYFGIAFTGKNVLVLKLESN